MKWTGDRQLERRESGREMVTKTRGEGNEARKGKWDSEDRTQARVRVHL